MTYKNVEYAIQRNKNNHLVIKYEQCFEANVSIEGQMYGPGYGSDLNSALADLDRHLSFSRKLYD